MFSRCNMPVTRILNISLLNVFISSVSAQSVDTQVNHSPKSDNAQLPDAVSPSPNKTHVSVLINYNIYYVISLYNKISFSLFLPQRLKLHYTTRMLSRATMVVLRKSIAILR